jgi:hypothetical protein
VTGGVITRIENAQGEPVESGKTKMTREAFSASVWPTTAIRKLRGCNRRHHLHLRRRATDSLGIPGFLRIALEEITHQPFLNRPGVKLFRRPGQSSGRAHLREQTSG